MSAVKAAELLIKTGKEAYRRGKRLIDKPSEGQQKIEKATMGQRAADKRAVQGAGAGATAMSLPELFNAIKDKYKNIVSSFDKNKMSDFEKAFSKARKEGKTTFTFEGKSFNTKLKEEK